MPDKITVTDQDIQAGQPGIASSCALARAFGQVANADLWEPVHGVVSGVGAALSVADPDD